MEAANENITESSGGIKAALRSWFGQAPLLGLLLAGLASVLLEIFFGDQLAVALGLEKVPYLFGIVMAASKPALVFRVLVYEVLIYLIPIVVLVRALAGVSNGLAKGLLSLNPTVSIFIHLGLLYLVLHLWSGISDSRVIIMKLTLISVMVTLSLNLVNGYMGEFSCSHPGFMALGAYATSVCTIWLFSNDRLFGDAVLSGSLGPFLFPLTLIFGGLVAALGAMVIAIPSFRTRGDYLAIISLAFTFIIKSLFENLEFVGGPRGMMGQPDYSNLPTVFIWCVICVWALNNFVRSTLGKATNAVRDDETAADAMTVNTRRTKMVAFMFAAFWAGVAGGLYAHVIRFINPATFSLQKLAEVLAMVYFGGLNSVYGSIVGAVSISFLGEMLRPFEIYKWIIIPLLLILVMIYRPTGLIAFKEFDPGEIIKPRNGRKEVE